MKIKEASKKFAMGSCCKECGLVKVEAMISFQLTDCANQKYTCFIICKDCINKAKEMLDD